MSWLLPHLVVTALFAGVVQAVTRLTRMGPVARHALWVIVLIKLLVPPLITMPLPWRAAAAPSVIGHAARPTTPLDPVTVEAIPAVPSSAVARTSVDPAWSARMSPAVSATQTADIPSVMTTLTGSLSLVQSRLISLWLTGSLIFAVIQWIRAVRLVRLVRAAGPVPESVEIRVQEIAHDMRITPCAVRLVSGVSSPAIWAVPPWRPLLIWPSALPVEVSEHAARALVVHELAHLKRRDHWVGWIELAAGIVWWWNPIYWYVRAQVREQAELACDGWVVRAFPGRRRLYAETIVTLSAGYDQPSAPLSALSSRASNRRSLERRLTMILQAQVPLRLSRAAVLGIAALLAMTLPAWAQRPVAPTAAPSVVPTQVTPPPVPAVDVPFAVTPVTSVPAPTTVPVVPQAAQSPTSPLTVPAISTVPVVVSSGLPDDAQKLVDQFAQQEESARREAEDKIARQRLELVQRLQALQTTYTKAGDLDNAIAVRNRVRQLQAIAGLPVVTIRPASLDGATAGRSYNFSMPEDQPFDLPVKGSIARPIWGDGIYTGDSSVAVAAVHAGLVAPGEVKFVRVTPLPGMSEYAGATRNGVTSLAFSNYGRSYRVDRTPEGTVPVVRLSDGGSSLHISELRGSGFSFTMEVIGNTAGALYGSDNYTDDSSVAAAAVHAGILKPGERGLVKITILPGQSSYPSTTRNGVTSSEWGSFNGSFKVEPATVTIPRR